MQIPFIRRVLPVLVLAALPLVANADVLFGVSVTIAPPPLPVYVQPPCPAVGYLWIPGYWAWSPAGYYWVPGTWVLPPQVGLLWTPGYWGWMNGIYIWHAGYWGPRVGFYGGIDYGFGYDGVGFEGGFWRGGIFFYNRAVLRVGPAFGAHVYFRRPAFHPAMARVSFNGGPGGIFARPDRRDFLAARERRFLFTNQQRLNQRIAFRDPRLRADFNHGRPPIAATQRPGVFRGPGVFGARAQYRPHMQYRGQQFRHPAAPFRGPGMRAQRFGPPQRQFRPQRPFHPQQFRPQRQFRPQQPFHPQQFRPQRSFHPRPAVRPGRVRRPPPPFRPNGPG
jgi:hypothetical protein